MVRTKNPYGVCGWAIMLALLSFGCSSTDHMNSVTTCDVKVYNHSSRDIRFVVIDPEGIRHSFGYLASGSPDKFKGKVFSEVRLSKDLAIAWQEEGVRRKALIDIAKYEKSQIKSFSFIYMGDGKWQVIARSGTDEASPEVKP
jgi:hypothetical protein